MPRAERLHLPSGRVAVLDGTEPGPVNGVFAADAALFRGRVVDASGVDTALRDLPLSDFHTLRALLRRLGVIDEAELDITCQNCDRRFSARASSALELGPYRDDELDDPELDALFDFEVEHRPETNEIVRVRLNRLTVGEAEALHVALAKPGALRITTALVMAMGIAALDGESNPRRIARRLMRVPADAFDAVVGLFETAHYPARLTTPHPCPECGAMAWIDAPAGREFSADPGSAGSVAIRRNRAGPPFVSLSGFEDLVSELADTSYDALGVRGVDLVVVDGPAECDDGGEPLLGCYRPDDPDALPPQPAEIRIFYRTFASLWNDEGEFDVGAEVETTLRHELEHHLAHLSGRDPVDQAEHAEIDAEAARRVGRSELERRAVRAAGRNLRDFFASTWILWLIALVATLVALYAEGR